MRFKISSLRFKKFGAQREAVQHSRSTSNELVTKNHADKFHHSVYTIWKMVLGVLGALCSVHSRFAIIRNYILTSPCLVIVAIQISSKTGCIDRWTTILAP